MCAEQTPLLAAGRVVVAPGLSTNTKNINATRSEEVQQLLLVQEEVQRSCSSKKLAELQHVCVHPAASFPRNASSGRV